MYNKAIKVCIGDEFSVVFNQMAAYILAVRKTLEDSVKATQKILIQ